MDKNRLSCTLKQYKNHPMSFIQGLLVRLSVIITMTVFLFLVIYILVKGIPNLTPELFSITYTSENVSMLPAIVNTMTMTLMALILAVPIGISSAIYLNEYSKSSSKIVSLIRITTETLAGIPSIVYGLFGSLIFVSYLKLGRSMLSGALTLAIMILPTIMRTAEEALKSVPLSYREGSFGLGAGRLRTVFKIILPAALPGILSGIILSVGRIAGETAALIYTSGTVAGIASAMKSGRTLSVHMYALYSEGLYTNQAYATAVILLIMVVIINALSSIITKLFSSKGSK